MTQRKGKKTPRLTGNGNRRDFQRTRVGLAEKIAEHLFYGEWTPTIMDEAAAIDFINHVLSHPGVVSRWGNRSLTVNVIPKRTGWAGYYYDENHMVLSLTTMNHVSILHELAHMLQSCPPDGRIPHGPEFVAIYRFLITLILGEEVGQIYDAAFQSFKLLSDDTKIPAVRRGYKYNPDDTIPGLTKAQARQAANALRAAASAGMFGDAGTPQRLEAFRIARKLNGVNPSGATQLTQVHRIPESVTIPVASLLNTDYRDDLAEIFIAEVRRQMRPAGMSKPAPISAAEKQRRLTYAPVRKAVLTNPFPVEASPLNPKNKDVRKRTLASKKKAR